MALPRFRLLLLDPSATLSPTLVAITTGTPFLVSLQDRRVIMAAIVPACESERATVQNHVLHALDSVCRLYTFDAADDLLFGVLRGCRIITT